MAPPAAGRMGGPQKVAIQIRLSQEVIDMADAFAAEMSVTTWGAQFSRAEAFRIAGENWLKDHLAGKGGAAPVVSDPDSMTVDLDDAPDEEATAVAPAVKRKGGRPKR